MSKYKFIKKESVKILAGLCANPNVNYMEAPGLAVRLTEKLWDALDKDLPHPLVEDAVEILEKTK